MFRTLAVITFVVFAAGCKGVISSTSLSDLASIGSLEFKIKQAGQQTTDLKIESSANRVTFDVVCATEVKELHFSQDGNVWEKILDLNCSTGQHNNVQLALPIGASGFAVPAGTKANAHFKAVSDDEEAELTVALINPLFTATQVLIESGAAATNSVNVTLDISGDATAGAETFVPKEMRIADGTDCTVGAWQTYSTTSTWTLDATYTVSVGFRDEVGNVSGCVTDSITYDIVAPTASSLTIEGGIDRTVAPYTASKAVSLAHSYSGDAVEMAVFANNSCTGTAAWEAVATPVVRNITTFGLAQYSIQYRDAVGNISGCVTDSIIHDAFSVADQTMNEDATLTIDLNASAEGGGSYSLLAASSNDCQSLTGETIVLSAGDVQFTPPANYNGSCNLKISHTDVYTVTDEFQITVSAVNDLPVISLTSGCGTSATEGSAYSCNLSVTDLETPGASLTWSETANDNCAWISATGTGGSLSLSVTPDDGDASCTLSIKASDGTGDSLAFERTITITPVNDAPSISSVTCTPTTYPASQDSNVSCRVQATDPDSTTLTWNRPLDTCGFISGPVGYLGNTNGKDVVFSGTSDDDDVAGCLLKVQADDGFLQSSTSTVSISFTNAAPTFSSTISNVGPLPHGSTVLVDAVAESDVSTNEEGLGTYSAASDVETSDPSCVAYGTVDVNSANGKVRFNPNTFTGTCYVKLKFDDGNAAANSVAYSNEFTITVSKPKVYFDVATDATAENLLSKNIVVKMDYANYQNVVVPITVENTSTALGGGTDYTLPSSVTILAGQTTVNLVLNINTADALDEVDEIIDLTMTNPTNALANGQTTHQHTITDMDAPPKVQFTSTTSSGSEGSTVNIQLELDAASAKTITVPISLGTGTATEGASNDFTYTNSVQFGPGDLTKTFGVVIRNDGAAELAENIEFKLITAPTNATLNTRTTNTLTIAYSNTSAYTWTGLGLNSNWSNGANWTGGAAPSTTSHVAVFNGLCTVSCNVTVDQIVNIGGITAASDYTGTITQTSNTFTIGSSGFTLAGGTFQAGSAAVNISGGLFITGGNYITGTHITSIGTQLAVSAGSFLGGSTNLNISGTGDPLVSLTGTGTLRLSSSWTTVTATGASGSKVWHAEQTATFNNNGGILAIIMDSSITKTFKMYLESGVNQFNQVYVQNYGGTSSNVANLEFAALSSSPIIEELIISRADANTAFIRLNGPSAWFPVFVKDWIYGASGSAGGNAKIYLSPVDAAGASYASDNDGLLPYLRVSNSTYATTASTPNVRLMGLESQGGTVQAPTGNLDIVYTNYSDNHNRPAIYMRFDNLFQHNNGTVRIIGDSSLNSDLTADIGHDGSLDLEFKNLSLISAGGSSANYLKVTQTIPSGAKVAVRGDFTIQQDVSARRLQLDDTTAATYSVYGMINLTNVDRGDAASVNSTIALLSTTSDQTISSMNSEFPANLVINKPGKKVYLSAGALQLVQPSQDLTIQQGTLDLASQNLIVSDGIGSDNVLTIATGGKLARDCQTVNAELITGSGIDVSGSDVTLSINDQTVNENSALSFTVSLSGPSCEAVDFNYATSDNTAVAGQDYTSASSLGTITATNTSTTIAVTISDDNIYEPGTSETFKLNITSADVPITDSFGVATITDNESRPTVSITTASFSKIENSAPPSSLITVALSHPSTEAISVGYTTGGTADGADYTITASPLNFAALQTSKDITLTLTGDSTPEFDDTVIITLNSFTNVDQGSTLSQTTTILNDDGALPAPGTFSISGVTGPAGSSDTAVDSILSDGTQVRAYWGTSSDAASYDVVIKDSSGTAPICSVTNVVTTNVTFSTSCATSLFVGTSYTLFVTAVNGTGSTIAANDSYLFQIKSPELTFKIKGIIGGSDSVLDDWLDVTGVAAGLVAEAAFGADEYEVKISNSADGSTNACGASIFSGTILAGNLQISVNTCILAAGSDYYAIVRQRKSAGTWFEAVNSPFRFRVPTYSTTVRMCQNGNGTANAVFLNINSNPDGILYDSGIGGNYLNNEMCFVELNAPVTLTNNGTFATASPGDFLAYHDGTDVSLASPGSRTSTFSVSSTPSPTILTSPSTIEWVSDASGVAAGFALKWKAVRMPQKFEVLGVRGGLNDSTLDEFLVDTTTPTIEWSASVNATSYDLRIFDRDKRVDVCDPLMGLASTSHTVSTCNLNVLGSYVVEVTAVSADGSTYVAASYPFAISNSAPMVTREAFVKAAGPKSNDQFGRVVDIDGNTMVVGVPYEDSSQVGVTNGSTESSDTSATNSGAVYVYTRVGNTWSQQAYIKPSNTDIDDQFGASVAISGDYIVVGAPYEDGGGTTQTGANPSTTNDKMNVGAAYVFERSGSTWTQVAYLKPIPDVNGGDSGGGSPGDRFGTSVAIEADKIIVGAPYEDSFSDQPVTVDNLSINSGAAYIFRRSGTWALEKYLKGVPNDNDNFGISVAISGNRAVVGAPLENSQGSVYVFNYGTEWVREPVILPSDPSSSKQFGAGVGVDGNTVVVAAPGDQSKFAFNGAVYVFSKDTGNWVEKKLFTPRPAPGDNLGAELNYDSKHHFDNIDISGNLIVVGARGDGAAEKTIAMNGAGDYTHTAASNFGAAYVFAKTSGEWKQQAFLKSSYSDSGDWFGSGVAISGDTVVVGSMGEDSASGGVQNGAGGSVDNGLLTSGAAYVFRGFSPNLTP